MKKIILFIYAGECHKLPPFLSILEALHEVYNLKVLSYETKDNRKKLEASFPGVKFLSRCERPLRDYESFTYKVIRRLYYPLCFHEEVKKTVNESSYDLLWIIHENTLLEFQNFLINKRYIVSFYELNDHDWRFIQKTQKGVQNAMKVISCEFNRSCIMRVWYHLNYTPTVVPNKPYSHPRNKNIPCDYTEILSGKKIIIYQGHIQRVRSVDKLCEALTSFPDYSLVLMGGGQDDYINELKEKYHNVIFTGFVTPPHHLDITSYARIGVVKYDHIYLDHTFCAPNKIWEYSGFGIPTLGNDLPGLEYTIGRAGAGVCVDFDDVEAIRKGISDIENNYEKYSNNSLKFYDSIDLGLKLRTIVEENINE